MSRKTRPRTTTIYLKSRLTEDREKMYILDYDNTLLSDNDFADAKETLRITKLSNNDEQGVTVPKPT